MRSALKAMFFALAVVAAPAFAEVAYAAEATPIRIVRAPAVAPATEGIVVVQEAVPPVPPPVLRQGCSRVWRCDSVICEWRRGCWGTYGYMEGPYNNVQLAKRQFERHGWPVPTDQRSSSSTYSK